MLNETIRNLNERGFITAHLKNAEEARNYLEKHIKTNESCGFGGSVTVRSTGIYDFLKERGNRVIWHWYDKSEDGTDIRRSAINCDCYITSVNAIVKNGDLVSIDGAGNRIAGMIYGGKRAFILASVDKICESYDKAINRIQTIACPNNARRLELKTPCSVTNNCSDCSEKIRMCRITTIYSYPANGRETHVVLVNDNIGY